MYVKSNNVVEKIVASLKSEKDTVFVLLSNSNDLDIFVSDFYLKNNLVIDDVLDFREYKIKQSKSSLADFMNDCENKGVKVAFEQTFYQYFSDSDVELINMSIVKGKITLELIFEGFKINPNKNIMKYVL